MPVLLGCIAAGALAAPEAARAERCFLLFQCPVRTPPSAPAAPPASSPLPPPPVPTPVPPTGPPAGPPPGNPECRPIRRGSPSIFIGVGDSVSSDPRDRRCTLANMVASRVGVVRAVFYWPALEAVRRSFRHDYYDSYVAQLARYRIRILPVLFGSPTFYSAKPSARHPDRMQPRRNSDFARFATVLVRRYGPRGSFWRSNPSLPRLPLRSWQIWNEANLTFFWTPRPSPRRYVGMLAAAARAIKTVDRRAEIVVGGLPESRFGTPVARYVRGIYRAGGRRWFDTMAIHPYARTPAEGIRRIEAVRRLMDRSGDQRARIWVTEFGWPTAGPRHRFRVSQRGQAARVRQTLRALWRRRRELRIRGAVYVFWRDLPVYRSDTWGLHLGLYRRDGTPKLAARTFRETARRLR